MFSVHLNNEDIDHWVSSPQVGVFKVLVDHSEMRGGRTRVEGCGGSGEGEAPGLVGERGRSFQVMRMEAWPGGSELPLAMFYDLFSCI